MFFDSHVHLDDPQFDVDREDVLNRLTENGVDGVLNAGAPWTRMDRAVELADCWPMVWAAAGVHPGDVKKMRREDLDRLELLTRHPKCVAIGEIGLDYHYLNSEKDTQRYWFYQQLMLAKELDLPVIIHDRDAHQDCLDAVFRYGVRGVFHCYSGSAEMAKELVRHGFYCSFTVVVTYQGARRALETIAQIPLERILIETDCPYLAPVPWQKKRNEPKNVAAVAKVIAGIRGVSVEKVAEVTAQNAMCLFQMDKLWQNNEHDETKK